MPRIQVYLPDHLYRAIKEEEIEVSELLQQAVRVELKRRRLQHETDRFLKELADEVGEPGPDHVAWAETLTNRMVSRAERAAG